MALLATQEVAIGGLAPVYSAVSASDTFLPDDRTFVYIKNAGGSADGVAIVTPGTFAGLPIDSMAGTVGAGLERVMGPFPAQVYADPTTGLANITHSFTTTVTAAVIRIPARV